jgi:group I intron endonuclease
MNNYKVYKDVSGIYTIKSTVSSKVYIGLAGNLYKRFRAHVNLLRRNVHQNRHLQNHFNKYGECFYFEVIEICDAAILIEREQYWIDTLKPAFNCNQVAEQVSLGKRSSDFKELMRKLNTGKVLSDNHKALIKASCTGLIKSDKTKQLLSASRKGITLSNTHRASLARAQSQPVIQYSKDGLTIIEEYPSAKIAAEKTLVHYPHICNVANKRPKYKTAGGFIWRWK